MSQKQAANWQRMGSIKVIGYWLLVIGFRLLGLKWTSFGPFSDCSWWFMWRFGPSASPRACDLVKHVSNTTCRCRPWFTLRAEVALVAWDLTQACWQFQNTIVCNFKTQLLLRIYFLSKLLWVPGSGSMRRCFWFWTSPLSWMGRWYGSSRYLTWRPTRSSTNRLFCDAHHQMQLWRCRLQTKIYFFTVV